MNLDNVKKYKEEFIEKVGTYVGWDVPHAWPIEPSRPEGGYPANSIFFSEALAIYTLAKDKEIDILIESGVRRGGSTSIWGRVFPDLKVYAIDCLIEGPEPRLKWEGVQSVIKPLYPQIEIFIDGPKYPGGLMLAESCFDDYENVMFSSLHDYAAENYFNTHDDEFRKIVEGMDTEHPQFSKYPKGSGLSLIYE